MPLSSLMPSIRQPNPITLSVAKIFSVRGVGGAPLFILAARHVVAESAGVVGGLHYIMIPLERDSESPHDVLVHGVVDIARPLVTCAEALGLVHTR
jgi:hypothetical protein